MIICQMNPRIKVSMEAEVYLCQVAQVDGPPGATFRLPLHCPKQPGVWKISALDAARALHRAHPGEEIMLLGPDTCYVHRVHVNRPDPFKWLRTVGAFSVLFFGSVLGLAAKSQAKLTMAAQLVFLPSIMLSGIMFPASLLPGPLEGAGRIFPAFWGYRAMLDGGLRLENLWYLVLVSCLAFGVCGILLKEKIAV